MFEKYDIRKPIKPVIGTDGKYLISYTGNIYSEDYTPVKTHLTNSGDVQVTLEINSWMQHVNIANLVIRHFKFIDNPYVLEQMDAFHIDGNKENNHANNLGYRFKVFPLEHETIKGWYYIPGNPGRLINKEQVAINLDGEVINFTLNKSNPDKNPKNITGGYLTSKINLPHHVSINFTRHRAMLLAFKHIPDNIELLVANHINGIPGDDRLENLEWVTRTRNNIHAVQLGLRQQNRPVLVKHVITGEVTEFASVALAARMMNVNDRGLNQMLNDRPFGSVNGKGYQIKYKEDERDWVIFNNPQEAIQNAIQRIGVKIRDCRTMKVVHANSQGEAETFTGVKRGTISYRLIKEDYSPLFGYQFIPDYLDEFPDFTEHELKNSLKLNSCKVYVKDNITGNIVVYNSIAKMVNAVGINCKAALRKAPTIYRKNLTISLLPIS